MNLSNFTEFKYGWRVVLSSAFGIGLGLSPLPFYTIGVFAQPLSQEFGWGIGQVMTALPVFVFTVTIAAPLVGLLTDRLGVRRVVLTSVFLFGISFILFMFSNGNHVLYLLTWGLMGITGAGTLPVTWTRAVNNWFHENRGLALGISLLGTGLFGAFAKLYASYFIENYDFRAAYLAVGLLPILIAFPLAYFFFRDTDDPKVADRVAKLKKVTSISPNKEGITLKQATGDYRFWILIIAIIPISFGIGGPIPNLEPLLLSKGFNTKDAVFLASIIGYSVITGRILGGFLIDRFWAPLVAFIMLSLPAISCFLLSQPDIGYNTAIVSIVILGFAAGVEYDILAFMVSRYFGMKNYAAIYGIIYGAFAIGAGFGPFVFGKSYEASGSYDQVLGYTVFAFIFGASLLLTLGKYPSFDKKDNAE